MSTLKARKRRVRRRSAKKRVRRTKGKKKRRKGGDPEAVTAPSRDTPATGWQCNPSTKGLYVNNKRDAGYFKRSALAMRRKDNDTFYDCNKVNKAEHPDHYRSCNVAGCYNSDPSVEPEKDDAFIKAYYARVYNPDKLVFEDGPAEEGAGNGGRRKSRRRRRRRRKKSKQSKKRRRRRR